MSNEQHIHPQRQSALDWLTAASPVLLMAFCFYRWTAPLSALMAVAGWLAVSALLQWAGLGTITAAPALAGGVWLALLLPAGAPLWLGAVGGAVAALTAALPPLAARRIPAARGLLHPVLTGWLFLRLVFPATLQTYTLPLLWASAEEVPTADLLLPLTGGASVPLSHLFFGIRVGAVGQGCAPVLLLALGYAALRRRASLIAPAAMIATVAALSWMVWGAPLRGVLVGGTVLAAVLLADNDHLPAGNGARSLTGLVAGGAAVLIRALAGQDGCAVAVLLACLLSPLYAPFLRLCRGGAGWLWGVLRRQVPPLAARVWQGLRWLGGRIAALAAVIFAKCKNKC